MKTPLVALAFAGLAATAIIAVASCSTHLLPGSQNVEVIIGDPNAKPPKYVELKHGLADEHDLQCALYKIKSNGGVCEITFLRGTSDPPDAEYCKHINNINCNTKKVIKSAAANSAGNANSAANDPNLMHRIASPYPADTAAVLQLLK
jgi:hypothetical protein